MKLSELKNHLNQVNQVNFVQPNGVVVPIHFHITEAGLISKHFIDCGGTVRTEKVVNFQLWTSDDTNHRLEPTKLLKIISLSEKLFGNEDLDIEIEYQTDTIGKYGLDFIGQNFILTTKQTDCLAKENCGLPQDKKNLSPIDIEQNQLETNQSCCTPTGGCC